MTAIPEALDLPRQFYPPSLEYVNRSISSHSLLSCYQLESAIPDSSVGLLDVADPSKSIRSQIGWGSGGNNTSGVIYKGQGDSLQQFFTAAAMDLKSSKSGPVEIHYGRTSTNEIQLTQLGNRTLAHHLRDLSPRNLPEFPKQMRRVILVLSTAAFAYSEVKLPSRVAQLVQSLRPNRTQINNTVVISEGTNTGLYTYYQGYYVPPKDRPQKPDNVNASTQLNNQGTVANESHFFANVGVLETSLNNSKNETQNSHVNNTHQEQTTLNPSNTDKNTEIAQVIRVDADETSGNRESNALLNRVQSINPMVHLQDNISGKKFHHHHHVGGNVGAQGSGNFAVGGGVQGSVSSNGQGQGNYGAQGQGAYGVQPQGSYAGSYGQGSYGQMSGSFGAGGSVQGSLGGQFSGGGAVQGGSGVNSNPAGQFGGQATGNYQGMGGGQYGGATGIQGSYGNQQQVQYPMQPQYPQGQLSGGQQGQFAAGGMIQGSGQGQFSAGGSVGSSGQYGSQQGVTGHYGQQGQFQGSGQYGNQQTPSGVSGSVHGSGSSPVGGQFAAGGNVQGSGGGQFASGGSVQGSGGSGQFVSGGSVQGLGGTQSFPMNQVQPIGQGEHGCCAQVGQPGQFPLPTQPQNGPQTGQYPFQQNNPYPVQGGPISQPSPSGQYPQQPMQGNQYPQQATQYPQSLPQGTHFPPQNQGQYQPPVYPQQSGQYPQTSFPPNQYPQTATPSNQYPQTVVPPNQYPQMQNPYPQNPVLINNPSNNQGGSGQITGAVMGSGSSSSGGQFAAEGSVQGSISPQNQYPQQVPQNPGLYPVQSYPSNIQGGGSQVTGSVMGSGSSSAGGQFAAEGSVQGSISPQNQYPQQVTSGQYAGQNYPPNTQGSGNQVEGAVYGSGASSTGGQFIAGGSVQGSTSPQNQYPQQVPQNPSQFGGNQVGGQFAASGSVQGSSAPQNIYPQNGQYQQYPQPVPQPGIQGGQFQQPINQNQYPQNSGITGSVYGSGTSPEGGHFSTTGSVQGTTGPNSQFTAGGNVQGSGGSGSFQGGGGTGGNFGQHGMGHHHHSGHHPGQGSGPSHVTGEVTGSGQGGFTTGGTVTGTTGAGNFEAGGDVQGTGSGGFVAGGGVHSRFKPGHKKHHCIYE
ncbi:unnamed protein product [Nezara viridula]|uniref:Uncharacterized protein n=1 Tax=Nezara viridula TaxID=85310 RepID=A0A9P0H661_NEZVI|nr:unnamed protein product [Nezara viridula]